jgi:hypothetical protein
MGCRLLAEPLQSGSVCTAWAVNLSGKCVENCFNALVTAEACNKLHS